jgi:YD repeat-containing protein
VTKLFMHIVVVLLVVLLSLPAVPSADQAQYVYDELGRLVGVVDGSGNAAVYVYDEVGNLLRIDRFTTGATGIGIFLVAPNSGLVGANVEIRGFGFSPTPSANQVTFGSTAATVVSATPMSLVVTVPNVPGGAVTVSVTNASGTANSPQTFTVLVPPIITGIDTPKVAQGTTRRVVIEGFNLFSSTTTTTVAFSNLGITGTILTAEATGNELPITLTVGAAVPPNTYTFSVTTSPNGGTVQSGTITVQVTAAVPSFNITKGSVLRPGVPAGDRPVLAQPGSVVRTGPPEGSNFVLTRGSVLLP